MDLKTFIDNFHSLAEAPNGIPKLREMILQLAVRGKLVPQEPNDLPAIELLKRITAEKKRLIAEGKIKKSKLLHPIAQNEVPYVVPRSWVWSRLSDIGTINPRNEAGDNVEAGFIPMSLISDKYGVQPHFEVRRWKDIKRGFTHFAEGDVAIAKITPCFQNGKSAVFGGLPNGIGAGTTELHVFRPVENMTIPDYVWLYLKTPRFLLDGERRMTGSAGQKRVPKAYFANNPFPLPPLAEQKRIVAKVDALMALCDELEEQKKRREQVSLSMNTACLHELTSPEPATSQKGWSRIRENFDLLYETTDNVAALRKSILQLAVMGKLVPQEPIDLPAPQSGKFYVYALECDDKSIYVGQTDDVLKRWKEHAAGKGAEWTQKHLPVRLVHWEKYNSREEAAQREKELRTEFGRKWIKRELAAGRTRQAGEPASVLLKKIAAEKERLISEGKIKKSKSLPPIKPDDVPYDLPEGWLWERLGMVAEVLMGQSPPGASYNEAGEGVPLINGPVEFTNGSFGLTNSTKFTTRPTKICEAGDLLVCVRGATTGRTNIASEKSCIGRGVAVVRPYVHDRFVHWFMIYVAKHLLGIGSGSTFPSVSYDKIVQMLFPLPPLVEQKRIVAKVDELMALCDELETKLRQCNSVGEKLMEAVVNQVAGEKQK